MMYVAYFSEFTQPGQSVASRVLRQAATFSPTHSKVVYWLVAMADYGLSRAQLLPQGVPVVAYVTYQLHRAFCPSGQVVEGSRPATRLEEVRSPRNPAAQPGHRQGRDYLPSLQQALYDKLMARPRGMLAGAETARQPGGELLSAAEVTRDLAGWTCPPAGTETGTERTAGHQQ